MLRLGIDLGGTNIVAGIVDENFKIISRAKRKTALPKTAEQIADTIKEAANDALSSANLQISDIESVGVGAPGAVNSKTGIIAFSNNLGFKNVNFKALMEERFGKKVYIENDANAAAYGEYIAGAGRGTKNFIMVTVGTGVGGGIILGGKIFSGSNGAGGEIGHMVIKAGGEHCSCGRNGCFEVYASATALTRLTKKVMQENKDSKMWEICGNDINKVNGVTAFDGMRKGDPAATGVVDEFIGNLSCGITNLVNIFQPDMMCIGGGISHEGEYLTKPLIEHVSSENYARNINEKTIIKTAELEGDAGVIGAAFLDGVN